jgi:Tfp pilus assembly protein PilF
VDLKWRISHVRGYLELGMIKEAKAELEAIPDEESRRPEVVALKVGFLQAREQWKELRKYARDLVESEPGEAGWWIIWAYAARRDSSVKAEKILLKAEIQHPADATIQFNLGCYACVLGNLVQAKVRIIRSITLDSAFLKNALDDPDLANLREADPDWINSEPGTTDIS